MNGIPTANMLISVFNDAVDINIEFTNAVSSLVKACIASDNNNIIIMKIIIGIDSCL